MNILIVSATIFEIKDLITFLDQKHTKVRQNEYIMGHHTVKLLITGVGVMHTSFAIGNLERIHNIDLAINLGICGSFDFNMKLGTVVDVKSDRLGDLGIEEADGNFLDVFDLKLESENNFPYHGGWLSRTASYHLENLTPVAGVTVHKVSGTIESIKSIANKYQSQIESMEGAAFFYACAKLNIPALQLRAISNYVEPRNKTNWKMDEAIRNLNQYIIIFLNNL